MDRRLGDVKTQLGPRSASGFGIEGPDGGNRLNLRRDEIVTPTRFRQNLLQWYARERRNLPWRAKPDLYSTLVSEMMLQQTRVSVVRDRFVRFMARFPNLDRLAAAEVEDVVAEWSGLGYYRRAHHLHAAARQIVGIHNGQFPQNPAEAQSLPGIGRYTAHAVLSIAYGHRLAVVDGNVKRVLSRLALLPVRPEAQIQAEADRLLDPDRPGDANQALMELGASVCLTKNPRCTGCPLRRQCGARRTDRINEFPPRTSRPSVRLEATTIWIIRDRRGRIWLEHRKVGPLKGLWMLPWRAAVIELTGARPLGIVVHAIMHRRYRCEVWQIVGKPSRVPGTPAGPGVWFSRRSIEDLPHSSLVEKAFELAQ